MVDVEYEWSVAQCYIPEDAVLTVSTIPPLVPESATVTATATDATLQVSEAALQAESATVTATANEPTLTLSQLAEQSWVAEAMAPVFAFPGPDATLAVADLQLAADTAPSVTATVPGDATLTTSTEEFDWDASEGSPTMTITAGAPTGISGGHTEPVLAIANRTNIQKGQILRVIRIDVQAELAKAAMPIYLGSALTRMGGVLAPLRDGEPFAGFAIEFSPADERRINIAESGEAELEVIGVTGPTDLDKFVYATDETTFLLDPPTPPPSPFPVPPFTSSKIGKVSRHIAGKRCMVQFFTQAIASV